MNRNQKILTYATGFVFGCLILFMIPRENEKPKEHPWHAQTALEGTYPMTVTDEAGRSVTLERQPRHFVSLAPSITEILFAMDMGDHLIAVTQWCDFPQEAKALRDAGAHVGAINQPNRETIAAYRPDLIVGTNFTPPEVYGAIENPPRTVAVSLSHDGVEDVLEDIAFIGKITGVPGKALRLIQDLKSEQKDIDEWLQPYRERQARKVLFLLSIEDEGRPGWAPGEGTWVNDLIRMSNGNNVATALGMSWGEVSYEALMTMNPEVLIVRDGASEEERAKVRAQVAKLQGHPIWKQVTAVREGNVRIIPHGPLNIPGPRIMDAYRSVAEGIWE
jgi:iron complex transport system substrate-binding protein